MEKINYSYVDRNEYYLVLFTYNKIDYYAIVDKNTSYVITIETLKAHNDIQEDTPMAKLVSKDEYNYIQNEIMQFFKSIKN